MFFDVHGFPNGGFPWFLYVFITHHSASGVASWLENLQMVTYVTCGDMWLAGEIVWFVCSFGFCNLVALTGCDWWHPSLVSAGGFGARLPGGLRFLVANIVQLGGTTGVARWLAFSETHQEQSQVGKAKDLLMRTGRSVSSYLKLKKWYT